jgi:hypothetical protein
MRKVLLLLCVFFVSLPTLCLAQPLPAEADYATLRADIVATPGLTAAVTASDWQAVADYYNNAATPDFWLWRNNIPSVEYRKALVGADIETLTVGKARSFEWLTGALLLPIDATDPNMQTSLGSVFGAGTPSRTNLIALAKMRATRAQKLYVVSGTGALNDAGISRYYGMLRYADVAHAFDPNYPL